MRLGIVRNSRLTRSEDLVVAVFALFKDKATESFIKAHIERLPFRVTAFYGNKLDLVDDNGHKLWPWGFWFNAAAGRLAPEFDDWLTTKLLSRLLRKKNVDVVLAEYGVVGSWIGPACDQSGKELFVHFHGFDASRRTTLADYRDAYARMFQLAAGVVAVSSAMRERLLELGAPADRLCLNPYGVDPGQFSGGAPADMGADFFAVGRFVEKKAPYLTILAFGRVHAEISEARLTMIGDGPLLGPCKRLVQALGLKHCVHFVGAKDSREVARQMRLARAFVQHSLVAEDGDSEGTPVAVIEAQMTGIPVISTRHAGIPDVVLDGETGLLVDEADVEGMSEAMIRVARDPNLAGAMGRAARERALANFTLDRHIGDLAQMILKKNRLDPSA